MVEGKVHHMEYRYDTSLWSHYIKLINLMKTIKILQYLKSAAPTFWRKAACGK